MADFIYVNPEYQTSLRDNGLLNLRRLLDWSEGESVGEHGPREVRRIRLPGFDAEKAFYLRKDHRVSSGEILSDLLGLAKPASRCAKTVRAIDGLEQAGIETMQMVCLIERRYLGLPRKAAALVTGVGGQDLYNQLLAFGRPDQRTTNPPERRELLRRTSELVLQVHRAKLSWPDFVAKHIYVERVSGTWQLRLIDVENMRRTFSAAERQRQFNQLLLSLRGLLTATDVLRMMIGYIGAERIGPRAVRRRLLERFFPDAQKWISRAIEEQKQLRALPEGRPPAEEEIHVRSGSITVNTRYHQLLQKAGLPFDDRIFTLAAGSELHKPNLKGRFRYRFEIRDHDSRPLWLYLKRTRRPSLADQIRRMGSGTLRHSSCWHERYIIKKLSALRIAVPLVVAYGEKMLGPYERASVMITEGIVGQSLERFVPKYFPRGVTNHQLRERREWIRELATVIRRLHAAGYCHRDLYFSHVFISFNRNRQPVFYLIDLGRCFKMLFRRQRWIVKDLAALEYSSRNFISATDRLRFMIKYLGVSRLDTRGKKLIRKVIAKADRIALHDRANKRVTEERPCESGPDYRTS